jgi:hypothetical protein
MFPEPDLRHATLDAGGIRPHWGRWKERRRVLDADSEPEAGRDRTRQGQEDSGQAEAAKTFIVGTLPPFCIPSQTE